MADNPNILAVKCGMIPAVHPNAAAMLALQRSISPVDTVYITPVPGTRTTTSDVNKNSGLNISDQFSINSAVQRGY